MKILQHVESCKLVALNIQGALLVAMSNIKHINRVVLLFCMLIGTLELSAKDISTLSGKIYKDAAVTEVYPTGIGIKYPEQGGIKTAYLDFSNLPETYRQEFSTPERSTPNENLQDKGKNLVSLQPEQITRIVTLSGRTYENVKIFQVYETGIIIKYPSGKTEQAAYINFSDLSKEVQQAFGYDPEAIAKAKQQLDETRLRQQKLVAEKMPNLHRNNQRQAGNPRNPKASLLIQVEARAGVQSKSKAAIGRMVLTCARTHGVNESIQVESESDVM